MATLQNAQIDQSFGALLKTDDNGNITATAKAITDGAGNATNMQMSNTETKFSSGTVDFTGATVIGAGGAAGLESGTGTNSLQNAIGTASNASGNASIALGKNALASGGESMAYGDEAQATQTSAAAFGQYAEATATYAIAFGRTSAASGDGAVAFGQQSSAAQAGAVAMGRQVTADTADTTHVRALKIVAPDGAALGGNGITMLSPDGTSSEVTVTNNSELAINGTPIGGGGGGGMVYFGTGKVVNTSYIQNDIVQSVFTIPANTFAAGDYFMIRTFENRNGLNATQYSSLWITKDAQTVGNQVSNPSNAAYSFSQIQTSQQGTGTMKRHCFISATTETNWLEESSGANDDAQNLSGGSVNANNIDWTVDQYVYLQMYSDSTTGTYTNYGMHLTKLN